MNVWLFQLQLFSVIAAPAHSLGVANTLIFGYKDGIRVKILANMEERTSA